MLCSPRDVLPPCWRPRSPAAGGVPGSTADLPSRARQARAPTPSPVRRTGPVGVAHQYCGALGKQANCQVAVSVHAVSDTASCPLNWRLFLPKEWARDTVRRRRTGVPEDVGHREKWRLALDALGDLATWQLVPPVGVADAGYGQNADFRAALAERDIAYVVGIRGDLTVQPHDAHPAAPAFSGTGRPPVSRYRQPPVTVAELAAAAGQGAFLEVTWREGSRGLMTSRFLAVRVRPAGVRPRRLAQQAAVAEHGRWDGVLPQARLPAEGPRVRTGRPASGCPTCLMALRSPTWSAWRRSAGASSTTTANSSTAWAWTASRLLAGLAPPRPPGHRCPRLPHRAAAGPKSRHTGLTLHQILDTLQDLLNCWDRHLHHLPPTSAQQNDTKTARGPALQAGPAPAAKTTRRP
ncbi:hypothetical protein QFZ22_000836 [Streptomyces canus]|uniref:Transposase IS701-like DDE domain-containing protein n=1 Tax=Streptomyces canus TaxID=58343 RepID=A0AAW8F430_9ACTN|nr:hypothetical protein [Streptomyces canus]